MPAGSTYAQLATYTFTGSQSTMTFSSIPTTYTDLVMVCSQGYGSLGANTGYPSAKVGNGSVDSGTNYSFIYLRGDGTSASSGQGLSAPFFNILGTITGANQFTTVVNFQNYANTSNYKNMIYRSSSGNWDTLLATATWRSTSAINTIQVYDYSGYNFSSGSTVTLYGITAA